MKTKALISYAVTAQLIRVSFFLLMHKADLHDAAHIHSGQLTTSVLIRLPESTDKNELLICFSHIQIFLVKQLVHCMVTLNFKMIKII